MLGRIIIISLLFVGANAANTKPTSPNFCLGCKSIVSFVTALNSSDLRDEYKDVLKSYCDLHYPPRTDQLGPCSLFVNGFFLVSDNIDPINHCDQIGACGETTALKTNISQLSNEEKSPSRGSKLICEFCEQTVEQAQATLTNPRNVELVRQQLDAFCDYMQVINEDKQCRRVVHTYLNQTIDFIKTIDPMQYCKSIQLCSAVAVSRHSRHQLGQTTRPQHQEEHASRLPVFVDFSNFGIETSVSIGGHQALANGKSQNQIGETRVDREGPSCVICKIMIKEMFKFLRDNKTEENIMLNLDRVCKMIFPHGPKLSQCDSMVKAYTKEIVQLLIDETDPEMICMLLEQCVHNSTTAITSEQSENHVEQHKFGLSELITALDSSVELNSARTCIECKMFINYLKDTLVNPKSQEYIKQWFDDHLCADLNNNELVKDCNTMVEEYSSTLFNAISGNLDPKSACIELNACSTSPSMLLIDVNPRPMSIYRNRVRTNRVRSSNNGVSKLSQFRSQMCDQCVNIIAQIDDYLSTHSIDGDMSAVIDKVCNNLPQENLKNQCTYIVKIFGSELAQWITNMHNPREVCTKMLIC